MQDTAPGRLIVTRPAAQLDAWVDALRAAGVDAAGLPLIAIEAAADPAPLVHAWQLLVGAELDASGPIAAVMFVSGNAVQRFFAALPAGSTWPAATLACATGPGTVAALRTAGVAERLIEAPAADAPQFDAEALWARLAARPWAGTRVLIVRGETGRSWLAERWQAAGADVQFVVAYRREAPQWNAPQRALLQAALADPARHCWLFSSSEAVGFLLQALASDERARLVQAQALATHPRIAAAAQAAGFRAGPVLPPDPQVVAVWWHGPTGPGKAGREGQRYPRTGDTAPR